MADISSETTRREWLARTAATAAGLTFAASHSTALDAADPPRRRFGMCDWSMGRRDVTSFELAKELGLDGVEVSIGDPPDDLFLREPKAQKTYIETARTLDLAIPSVAMGLLNQVPLMSEPRAALWVADTIEVARTLGAKAILLAFFSKGELRGDSEADMRRVTEALIELAPRAEKAGVILGLETYLNVDDHLRILDRVGSKAVQVYYDVFNSASKGYDVVAEIKKLGRDRICQVHVKEGRALLGSGAIDWPAVAAALDDIDYRGWIVLETSSPNDVLTDTRANLAYVRKVFARLKG